jgi:hypothetical protein
MRIRPLFRMTLPVLAILGMLIGSIAVPAAVEMAPQAIASGSDSTTPSRTTDPTWFTTQIDVRFNDTSSPI